MARRTVHNHAWVLVGDGRKALLLRNEGDPDLLNLRRVEVREQDNPPTHEQGRSAPGRSFSSVGAGRSAVETTDWHDLEEERFAISVAETLNRAAENGLFKHLVVVAPPRALADLRAHFSRRVQDRITFELNKDLTGHPIPDIEKILSVREED